MKAQKRLHLLFKSIPVCILILSFSSKMNAQELNSDISNNFQPTSFHIKTSSYKIPTFFINTSNLVADFYQTPLEITQEKNSTIKKRFRETKNWTRSLMWTETPNWTRKLFS